MKQFLITMGVLSLVCTTTMAQQTSDYPITPLDFTHVQVTDNFWLPRIETNEKVTIPHSFKKCTEEGRVDNFIFAAGLKEGKWKGSFGFDDTDIYKTLEGASFSYQINKDQKLRLYMDTLINYIGRAQLPDGYLYTAWNLKANDYSKAACLYREERYDNLRDSHEFYNAGHMYEAAVAHYLATGQRNFLDIAIKNADLT